MKLCGKICSIKPGLLLVLAMATLVLFSSPVSAEGGARVYLQPVDSAEGTLTVDVIAENVAEMYGAEVRLKYDPTVLSVLDADARQDGIQIEAGNFLPVNQGFTVVNKVDETAGTITYAITLLKPALPVNGSGPLARVTFNVLQDIPATIDIEKAKLVAINLQTIPSEALALTIGHDHQTMQAPAASSGAASPANVAPAVTVEDARNASAADDDGFPWWVAAVGIMVLGLASLAALIAMGGLKGAQRVTQPQLPPAQTSKTQATSQTTSQHPKPVTRRRPSASK
jgi:hypothetical protein